MTEHNVGPASRFVEGRFVILDIGQHQIGVVRMRDGALKAMRNRCPHKGAPICRGTIGGTWPPSAPGELTYDREGEILVCPWHGYEYSLHDGVELYQNVPTRLRMFPVAERDGSVFVTV